MESPAAPLIWRIRDGMYLQPPDLLVAVTFALPLTVVKTKLRRGREAGSQTRGNLGNAAMPEDHNIMVRIKLTREIEYRQSSACVEMQPH